MRASYARVILGSITILPWPLAQKSSQRREHSDWMGREGRAARKRRPLEGGGERGREGGRVTLYDFLFTFSLLLTLPPSLPPSLVFLAYR